MINSPLPSRHKIAIQAFSRVFVVTIAIALLAAVAVAFFNKQEQLNQQRLETRLKAFEMRSGALADGSLSLPHKERLEGMKSLALSVIQYLRTPMSLMLGQAQIAQAAKDSSQIRSALTQIENAARSGREFLEGLAKSNGLEKFDVKPFVVETVVHQALAKTRYKIETAGIQIEENFKSRGEAEISVNELRGALENLIRLMAERLKNSPHTEKRLSVDIEQLGSLLRLRFADNGLSPESGFLKKFFEPFAVAELQMATLRALAESFQGTVRAEKNDPQGLRVEIDLPTVIGAVTKDESKDSANVAFADAKSEMKKPVTVDTPPIHLDTQNSDLSLKDEVGAPPTENILAGRTPIDPTKSPPLPPPPSSSPEVMVKEELSAAEELSVVIRKPKVRSDA